MERGESEMKEGSKRLLNGESGGGGSDDSVTSIDSSLLTQSQLIVGNKNKEEEEEEEVQGEKEEESNGTESILTSTVSYDVSLSSVTSMSGEGSEKSMKVSSDVQWPLSEGVYRESGRRNKRYRRR